MIFYLIGIDYQSKPLFLQEAAYCRRLEIKKFLVASGVDCSLFFTCQRLEIYGFAGDTGLVFEIQASLSRMFPGIFASSYLKIGTREITRHSLRLACGLESQILGELQIIDQLKQWSKENEVLGLREFWQKVLAQAELIKASLRLKVPEADLSRFVIEDLANRLVQRSVKRILVVGTGVIARLFTRNRPNDFIINFASRKKHSRARQLARVSGGRAILLSQVSEFIPRIDALISATTSPHYILQKRHLRSLGKKEKPFYIYDLAVPRDVSPQLGRSKQVVLEDLRSLNRLFDEHRAKHFSYVQEIEALIEEKTDESSASRDTAEFVGFKAGPRNSRKFS